MKFSLNYNFICKNCSPTGLEIHKRSQASIPQILLTTLANLQQESAKEGTHKTLFSKDKEIIPFIENYWDSLTTLSRRVTQTSTWPASIHKSLLNNPTMFVFDVDEATGENVWGLKNRDLSGIKPNYEVKDANGKYFDFVLCFH